MIPADKTRVQPAWNRGLTAVSKRLWAPFALVVIMGALDLLTGVELSFGIFYLLPVIAVAWWHGAHRVVAVAVLAGIAWFAVDIAGGRATHPAVPYWNALTRLGFFLIVGLLVHRARQLQIRQLDLFRYVVHDLRNPLMIISGNLELVADAVSGAPAAEAEEGLERCRVAGKRMGTLIDSLLDLSRLEEGRMPLSVETLSASSAVQGAIHETSMFACSKNIRLTDDVSADSACVRADPTLLHRVLVNLLTNAVKVTPRGGSIRVCVEPGADAEVIFAVVDGGRGIPAEYVSRVFDKFVQIQLQNSGVSTGSGLGLAFCRLAVTAQKGRIWIENVANNGARVSVALPSAGAK